MPKRSQRKSRSKKRTQRKSGSKKRTQRKSGSKKRSQRKSRSKKRSQRKSSRKGDDAKIIAYFKRHLKKYGRNYSLGGAWIHPITGNQVRVSDKAKRLLKQAKKEMGYM
jgi:adenylate kinase/ribonuclease R